MTTTSSDKTAIQVGTHFLQAKNKLAALGNPMTEEAPWQYTIQQLEHGWMLYYHLDPDGQNIIVLFELPQQPKSWMKFPDTWDRESKPDSCPSISDPGHNLVKPKRGFGKVWCELPQRTQIGFGLHVEFSIQDIAPRDELYSQEFERGRVFGGGQLQAQYVTSISGRVVFILKADKSWELVTF